MSETMPADVVADAQAAIEHVMKGKALDPEVERRISQRADEIREGQLP